MVCLVERREEKNESDRGRLVIRRMRETRTSILLSQIESHRDFHLVTFSGSAGLSSSRLDFGIQLSNVCFQRDMERRSFKSTHTLSPTTNRGRPLEFAMFWCLSCPPNIKMTPVPSFTYRQFYHFHSSTCVESALLSPDLFLPGFKISTLPSKLSPRQEYNPSGCRTKLSLPSSYPLLKIPLQSTTHVVGQNGSVSSSSLATCLVPSPASRDVIFA